MEKKLLLVVGTFIALASHATYAGSGDIKVSKSKCQNVSKNIDNVNSQLRSGYSVKQGERLKERLRDLRKLKRACVQDRLPTKKN